MAIRITGGEFRGRLLEVPKKGVRPTLDRVRAAIFSALQDVIPGARVLDLFAGTGAFGLEALSRGAACACFVENDHKALVCLEKNAERLLGAPAGNNGKFMYRNFPPEADPPSVDKKVGPDCQSGRPNVRAAGHGGSALPSLFAHQWRIVRRDAGQFLKDNADEKPYDLVFADPPYEASAEWTKKILFHLSSGVIFDPNGRVIIESGTKSPVVEAPGWKIEWDRTYGETRVCMYGLKVHGSEFTVQG